MKREIRIELLKIPPNLTSRQYKVFWKLYRKLSIQDPKNEFAVEMRKEYARLSWLRRIEEKFKPLYFVNQN